MKESCAAAVAQLENSRNVCQSDVKEEAVC